MKKLVTVKNILVACASLMLIIAFILMFAPQIQIGSINVKTGDTFFGNSGSIWSFIGYLLFILTGGCFITTIFLNLDEKTNKIIKLGAALLIVVAAILVFLVSTIYNNRLGVSLSGITATPIIAGILAILAACLAVVSEFAPNKKLLK